MTGQVNIRYSPGVAYDVHVEVNPNAYHGHDDPEIYIARFEDTNRIPVVGDEVTVVQPDDDPSEGQFQSTAEVQGVDFATRLITLRVDWKGFHVSPPELALACPFTVNYPRVQADADVICFG